MCYVIGDIWLLVVKDLVIDLLLLDDVVNVYSGVFLQGLLVCGFVELEGMLLVWVVIDFDLFEDYFGCFLFLCCKNICCKLCLCDDLQIDCIVIGNLVLVDL